MTEAELQSAVIEFAQLLGWKCAHFRPGMNQRGRWMTAVQGDGAGFPDLVLVKDGRLLFAELKQDGKYPSAEQRAWLEAINCTPVSARVWRPKDWADGTIERALRGPPRVSAPFAERATESSEQATSVVSAVADTRSAGRQP